MNSEKTNPVMIAIIEDNRFIRKGFEIMLNNEPDFDLVGSYQSCEEAFYYEEISKTNIVLMDIKLPGISGIEGIKYLKKHFPEMLIIVCTAYEDDENVFQAIAAGAVGFISKKASPKELVASLRKVATGGSPMTPNVARNILSSFEKPRSYYTQNESELTDKEKIILEKISSGKSYVTTANELSLSEEDILLNIRSIYGKLHKQLTLSNN